MADVMTQTNNMVVWTALARERIGAGLRLSVFASVRLGHPEGASVPLGQYAAVSGRDVLDWPGVLSFIDTTSTGFSVSFDIEGIRHTRRARLGPSNVLDQAVYQRIFNSATRVDPYAYKPRSAFNILPPYNVKTVVGGIKRAYSQASQIAASMTAPAESVPPPRLPDAVTANIGTALDLAATLDPALSEVPANAGADLLAKWQAVKGDAFALEMFRAARFYNYGNVARRRIPGSVRVASALVPMLPVPKPGPREPDFHQIIAHLGDFPFILRKLGFIFDLVVDAAPALSSKFYLSVSADANGTGIAGANWTQRSVAVLTAATANLAFPTATSVGEMSGGMINLADPGQFSVDSLDVDGSFFKATQGAAGELPALRSGGLTVFHDARLNAVNTRLNAQDLLNARLENPATVNAVGANLSSLARGIRVDVNVDNAWHSLSKRHVAVKIGDLPTIEFDDEGYVKATGLTTSGGAPDAYKLHEAVFGWDGWSLVAPRPPLDGSPPAPSSTPPGWGLQIQTSVTATPGTLPRLRFGKTYKLRARVADIAGGGLGLGDPVDTGFDPSNPSAAPVNYSYPTAPTMFVRHDPVASPAMVLRAAVTEGESNERLVIRSNPVPGAERNATQFAADLNVLHMGMSPYLPTSERHLAPPHLSFAMSELHGAVDGLLARSGLVALPRAAQKAGGSFESTEALRVATGSMEPTYATIVTPPSGTGQYVINATPASAPDVPLPYLPDPMATQIALNDFQPFRKRGLPPVRSALLPTVVRPITGLWPDGSTFRIVLMDGPVGSLPSITPGSGADPIRVSLPPGSMITMRYSSALSASDRQVMAYYAELDAASRARVDPLIDKGKLDIVTPSRDVTLVHATPRPRIGPALSSSSSAANSLLLPREVGDTFVRLNTDALLAVPCNDTGKVAIEASWAEPTAPTSGSDPSYVPHSGHVYSFNVAYADGSRDVAIPAVYDPLASNPDLALQPPRHELGDTKARTITYTLVGATRYREYFPADYTADETNVTTKGASLTVLVPSSARPPPVRVLEVVPTFRWLPTGDGSGRTRVGGGLRVYVDGEWFLSGEGERLAVLLCEGTRPVDAYGGRVSGWGADPLFYSDANVAPLDVAHFRPAPVLRRQIGGGGIAREPIVAAVVAGVPISELAGVTITAVAYDPQWNPDRGLWFFDIEVAADKLYFPFVRLALARMQQSSTSAALVLSPVTLADVAQLAPDRTISAIRGAAVNTYDLTVSGFLATNVVPLDPVPPGGGRGITRLVRPKYPGFAPKPSLQSGRFVRAEVQASKTPDRDLSWSTVVGPIALDAYTATADAGTPAEGTVYFKETLLVPPASVPAGAKLRILVREIEAIETDPDVAAGTSTIYAGQSRPVPYQERVVYADTVAIS